MPRSSFQPLPSTCTTSSNSRSSRELPSSCAKVTVPRSSRRRRRRRRFARTSERMPDSNAAQSPRRSRYGGWVRVRCRIWYPALSSSPRNAWTLASARSRNASAIRRGWAVAITLASSLAASSSRASTPVSGVCQFAGDASTAPRRDQRQCADELAGAPDRGQQQRPIVEGALPRQDESGVQEGSCADASGQLLPLAGEPALRRTDLLDQSINVSIGHAADTSSVAAPGRASSIGRPYGMAERESLTSTLGHRRRQTPPDSPLGCL